LNVKIILPKDKEDTALLLGGKKMNFSKGYFDRFAIVLKLNEKQINAVYKRLVKWLPEANQLIDISFLTEEYRMAFKELLTQRVKQFTF
jgi:serine/threonine-protein kinase HipA